MDPEPDRAGRYGAALLFVAWSAGSDRPAGHLETEYLAFGMTSEGAVAPLLALSLQDVKTHLDRCIDRIGRSGDAGEGEGTGNR